MFPKIISIGDFFLPTYGLLVSAAFLTGLWVIVRLARRSGLETELVANLGLYCALSGLAGAKLLMVALDFDFYRNNPGEIFSLTTLRAAGVFYGGLVVALLTAWFYIRSKRLPGLKTLDVFAPAIALGHAIGRVGCFAAGCCWGVRCDRSWAVTFSDPEAHRLVGVPLGVPLHPTQLYEAAAEGMVFVILYRRFHRRHADGAIIGLYLVLYPAVRFLVEFVRDHERANPFGGPLSASQWIALGLAFVGFWLLRTARRRSAGAG